MAFAAQPGAGGKHCLLYTSGVLFVDQLFFEQRAEQHGECAQVDDNAGDQVGNFAGEILGGRYAPPTLI